MPCIKIVNSGYKSTEQMMNLINYVISDEQHITNGLTGGNMILTGTPQYIYDQMMDVKNYYNKAKGRFMQHIIVSPSDRENKYIDIYSLYMIAMRICNLFPGYQTLFAIHLEKDHKHLHFAINTVSYLDGSKIRILLSQLRLDIQKIFAEYVPSLYDSIRKETTITTFDDLYD